MSGCFGSAKSIGHAGELLQGVIGNEPFLVTLPAPPFTSHAVIRDRGEVNDRVQPTWRTKALRAARIAWKRLGGPARSFQLTIDSATPVGRGCGSSTSDCVAAIRAAADLLDCSISAHEIAQWSAEAEIAADATMFDLRPVAFSQRRGLVLRELGESYPAMKIVAVDLGGPSVDSVARPALPYSGDEIAAFQTLLALLEKSIEQQDAAGVARVATESAAIHQRHQPHARWQNFIAAVQQPGLLGVGCAHSGTIAVALLDMAADDDQLAHNFNGVNLPALARYELAPTPKGEAIACLSF